MQHYRKTANELETDLYIMLYYRTIIQYGTTAVAVLGSIVLFFKKPSVFIQITVFIGLIGGFIYYVLHYLLGGIVKISL